MAWNVWANLVGALIAAAVGLAAILRGWLLPWMERCVFRPRWLGAAELCIAAAMGIGALALSGAGDHWTWLPLLVGPFLLASAACMLVSQVPPADLRGVGAPPSG